ncbi:MAG TPA: glycosyltransferase [Steroidobacteraceae bacterium]
MPARNPVLNIIGKSNGVGLARDLGLLASALRASGYEVRVTTIDAEQARRRRSVWSGWQTRLALLRQRLQGGGAAASGVNLMLEHVWSQYLPEAHYNVVIPNPEWFDANDRKFLAHVDVVWAKTEVTGQIFDALRCSSLYIGFDSEDRYDSAVTRQRFFLHSAGKSSMKGTQRLLQVWARHPQWPKLLVLQHKSNLESSGIVSANIELRLGYMQDDELKSLQNAALFHVCTSITEGWGHYIAEALSVGAVTITVDAPPMNELITAERGLLVPYSSTGKQRLATTYLFDEAGLETAIEAAIALDEAQCQRLSANARTWFLRNKQAFPGRLQAAMGAYALEAMAASAPAQ